MSNYIIFYRDKNGDNFEAWVDAKTVNEAIKKSKVNPHMITVVAVDTGWTYQTKKEKVKLITDELYCLGYRVLTPDDVLINDIDPDRATIYFKGERVGIWDFVKKTFVD